MMYDSAAKLKKDSMKYQGDSVRDSQELMSPVLDEEAQAHLQEASEGLQRVKLTVDSIKRAQAFKADKSEIIDF